MKKIELQRAVTVMLCAVIVTILMSVCGCASMAVRADKPTVDARAVVSVNSVCDASVIDMRCDAVDTETKSVIGADMSSDTRDSAREDYERAYECIIADELEADAMRDASGGADTVADVDDDVEGTDGDVNTVNATLETDDVTVLEDAAALTETPTLHAVGVDESIVELRSAGVVNDGETRYTWYSENVLPGDGLTALNSNGRTVDHATGVITDGDGYIAVASNDHPQGTVLETPWGLAKVYDCGCDSGVVDVYVSW